MNDTTITDSDPGTTIEDSSLRARLKDLWDVEFANLRWRMLICMLLMRLLPEGRAAAFRTSLMRAVGVDIGTGTRIFGRPVLQSQGPGPLRPRLRIGSHCTIGKGVILEFGEQLTIGNRVALADGAVILNTTHQLGPKEHRAGPVVRSPVTIGDDVVIGENAIILPGASIGDGARVLPNSAVNAKVRAGVTVGGIPARPQRSG